MTTATAMESARLMVGMEVHIELNTRSKMWTSAANVAHRDHYDAEPNTLTDPVVIGMPGTLPVINKAAIEKSILVGRALGCRIAEFTKWDRKSYYYPDLPKNYQISQYDLPLCYDGAVDVPLGDNPHDPQCQTKRIGIIRAHLEEDAGKLLHEAPGGGAIDYSIVDLNRAGTPLLEIVTEPDFETPEQCVAFANMLRDICRHLGVSDCIMQRGHMRFEPNINVIIERDGKTYKTPIAEIKNLNSFKSVHGAIAYEYQRQIEDFIQTGEVMAAGAKSTRGWDDNKQITFLQREKEDAHDYRYFPDPDLVPVTISAAWLAEIESHMPELPLDRTRRYIHDLGINEKDAAAIVDDPHVCRFFESVVTAGGDPRKSCSLLLNQGMKRANEMNCRVDELGITPMHVKDILDLVAADQLGSSAAAEVFNLCCDPAYHDTPAQAVAKQHNLLQVSDTGALDGFIEQIISDAKNAKVVADIQQGKDAAVGALLGQLMKLSKGKANPKVAGELIKKKIHS